ncbi:MAG: T9SS type A sorting domain-containing protein [Ignavibacterium sp.]|nr:T9SS type A sorting domain-containing protein [Ignavibacterium sp.]MDX9711713.1 T9SS type A sorting domain-containing protein [Ignavibacteriaceae bacterium]
MNSPVEYSLEQNYPNPFNPTTQINYSLKEAGLVQIKIYDILGKEIATLINENKEAGNYSVDFNAAELPSGVYIYQLTTPGFTQARKMILAK